MTAQDATVHDDASSAPQLSRERGAQHAEERRWEHDPERELSSSVSLFEGDEGGLDVGQRRTLVALLKNRFITAASHKDEWRVLLEHRSLLRARLNDLFLDLHVDPVREVAFKRQVKSEGGARFPTLVHDTAWNREETILLVFLRRRDNSERGAGATTVFIDRSDMLEHVASLRPAHATDESADAKRATKAVESLHSAGLLIGASDDDRFEVSPAVEVLLPLEMLTDLLQWIRAQNNPSAESATAPEHTQDTSEDSHGNA